MKKKEQALLPHKFKYLSVVIGAIIILIPFTMELLGVDLGDNFHYTRIFEIAFVVTVSIFILSRDKIEDERTMAIRLKAYSFAMIFGVIHFTIHTIMGLFDGESVSAFDVVLMTFAGYFIFYLAYKEKK